MPREFNRTDRVADQIQRELAVMIQREVKDPRLGMVSISEVKVSRDFGYADVYITLLATEEPDEGSEVVQQSLAVLEGAAGFLRTQLGQRMRLRIIPRLRFHFDRLAGQSRRMDALIKQAVSREKPASDDGSGD